MKETQAQCMYQLVSIRTQRNTSAQYSANTQASWPTTKQIIIYLWRIIRLRRQPSLDLLSFLLT